MVNPEIRSGMSIDDNDFDRTLRYIRPHADELDWQTIPWQTDLFEAVQIARQEQKPVLLWTMNGNPLGCT